MNKCKHPAKYNDNFITFFYDAVKNCKNILDPFAGTGKIGLLKQYGFTGTIYANEMEKEWLEPNEYNCDILTYEDAENLNYQDNFFDAICTSPTYGNRMADHHIAKDDSKRITYTHYLGHQLHDGNTGKMQWGKQYRNKHIAIYNHLYKLLKHNGLFIINVKNHIRKGELIDVCQFHKETLLQLGFTLKHIWHVEVPSMKFGQNKDIRVTEEQIMILQKM